MAGLGWLRKAAVGAAGLVLISGCGSSPVVDAPPEAAPYDGPLFLDVTAAPTDETADRSGAAGRVVDCDSPARGDSSMGVYGGGSVSRSSGAALKQALREGSRGATEGFRQARTETDRVLYTYEVERRTKIAYVVHRGPAVDGRTGWYVESWAACNWAELPPEAAEGIGLQVWSDAAGRRVSTALVVSGRGPEHCNWQSMTFLNLAGGDLERGQTYVAHPHAELYPDYFSVPYVADARLPATARDTGYVLDGRHLWLAPDRSRAFVGTPESVEVWPRTVERLGCA